MKYLCLAYYDAKQFETFPGAEMKALEAQCGPLMESLKGTKQMLSSASLADPKVATVLRPKKGKTSVTDGPFIETHEQLGSFFLIEARDLNDAIRVASKHPAASIGEELGWAIEIRPVEHYEGV